MTNSNTFCKPSITIYLDFQRIVPDSPSVIKYLYDHYKIKFIVTGSSSYYLKNLFSESLSGRKKLFELFPLDFGEFLTFKGISFKKNNWTKLKFDKLEHNRLSSYYNEFIRFGGFPQVVLSESESEKNDNLKDIFSSYVSIDIRTLADFSDERNLYNLAKLLASRIGNKVDYSKISRLSGLSRPTVTNYISFFEKTYLIKTIGVFTSNNDREIVKSRKLYFCDTGIANILADLSSGSQFENSLYNQLSRECEIQYYSLKNGNEIDFIINGKIALEAKETPTIDDLSRLKTTSQVAKLSEAKLVGRNLSPNFDNYIWGGLIT